MWSIKLRWFGREVELESGFKTRDDAEWRIAQWKQNNKCYGDPFATEEKTVCPN